MEGVLVKGVGQAVSGPKGEVTVNNVQKRFLKIGADRSANG